MEMLTGCSLIATIQGQSEALRTTLEEGFVATTVAQMTPDEFKEMIGNLIEQKLLELFSDPDDGLELKQSVRARLLRQKKAVARGARGEAFEEAVSRMRLG